MKALSISMYYFNFMMFVLIKVNIPMKTVPIIYLTRLFRWKF